MREPNITKHSFYVLKLLQKKKKTQSLCFMTGKVVISRLTTSAEPSGCGVNKYLQLSGTLSRSPET